MRSLTIAALGLVVFTAGCNFRTLAVPEPQRETRAPEHLAPVPPADAAALTVADGFRAEAVVTDLIYPTSAEVDDAGNLYIAEAGFVYGDHHAPARILRVTPDGQLTVYAEGGLTGPINDILFHEGTLFVSHRGKVSIVDEGGDVRDIVEGLPSLGDHQNNQLAAGPDGKLYLGQGTATSAGVVGLDSFAMQWLGMYPDFHDVPAQDVRLRGEKFTTVDVFILAGGDPPRLAATGAFQPFGQSDAGTVKGRTKANGTVLRFGPGGQDLEVYAWGLRNPYGVMWMGDTLYATENGFDARGSRPIANDPDDLYVIKKGAWYGWPDFAAGQPVTDPKFKPRDWPQPEFLMAEHPPVEQPLMTFPPHAGVAKLAASPGGTFGDGLLFMAVYGEMTPLTGRSEEAVEAEAFGRQVYAIDPGGAAPEPFVRNRDGNELDSTPGLRRPIDVVFSPAGDAMYVVDLGVLPVLDTKVPTPSPRPGSGVLWRITRSDAEEVRPAPGVSAKPGRQPASN